ncbi:methyltransferase [Halomonas urumqiensis]|uniref:Methyltransferase n=1 Tax=Halomonas urumqiensis TaxID=1684789 RepID=A0A2N7UQU2_9GAMM|nr:methyltransferase [Halomonas urumqiensis]PMR82808.1 methyltransferase [Halomonas urumqiensis]PTB01873.1 methyltransferase [Halomonas urumqiensis]GHE21977.1 SAM-dependent methyltransferase [Halomonas urumqiensis]
MGQPRPTSSLDPAQRFARLTELLAKWQAVWRPAPFMTRTPPWAVDAHDGVLDGLYASLLALSDEDCVRLESEPFIDSPLTEWLPVSELAELVSLPRMAPAEPLPEAWNVHVGGRKWRQIEAFVPQVRVLPGQSLVEWCAGKGHLARTLARRHGIEVSGLEWEAGLCESGQALAARQGVALELVPQDVMADDAERWLGPDRHVAALHACGDLHTRLLRLVSDHGGALTLAPCCYQRTADKVYRPLSRHGREVMAASGLGLSRDDLALAVQETVTAPLGVQRRRAQASAWRLGFDLLQRDVRGDDRYLPVPSLAYGKLPTHFADFCHWAARQKGLELPGEKNWAAFEEAGWRRLHEVKRLELVRHLFRRPLEVWLALDRLRLLEEAGFHAELGTFCARELTPRNLLLRASRP